MTNADSAFAQSFSFDYWAGGGDLRNLRELQEELRLRLSKTFAPGDSEAYIQTRIRDILQQISQQLGSQNRAKMGTSLWDLNLSERANLVNRWRAEVDEDQLVYDMTSLHMRHCNASDRTRASFQQTQVKALLDHNVVGITTTACAARRELLEQLELEVLICEEAAEVMEAQTICSLLPSLQHAIFIGDPLQLRPEVAEQSMSLETIRGSQYRLDESLFERFVVPQDPAAAFVPVSNLNVQRRMHPDIADITRLTYPFLVDHPSTAYHPATGAMADRMFWFDHQVPESDPTEASKSHVNLFEVEMTIGLVNHLIRHGGVSLGEIAVLTPYNGQLAVLHENLKGTCKVWLSNKDREALLGDDLIGEDNANRDQDEVQIEDLLRLATVDNFQGEEAKVIILTTVRSGGRPGFLKTINRINVACSRARDGFYIIGNAQTLSQVCSICSPSTNYPYQA